MGVCLPVCPHYTQPGVQIVSLRSESIQTMSVLNSIAYTVKPVIFDALNLGVFVEFYGRWTSKLV